MIRVGIENHWQLEIGLVYNGKEIPDKELAQIPFDHLTACYFIEQTGNILPSFGIGFKSADNWAKYWNENSHLKLSLSHGSKYKKMVNTKMAILSKDAKDMGDGTFHFSAEGVYVGDKSATVMCQTPYVQTMGPSEGTVCLEDCAKKFFKKVTNEAKSKGKMPWYQKNQSYKKFMDSVVRHSYIEKSFVIVGITMNGEYRILDAVKKCSGKEDWNYGKTGKKALPFIEPPVFMSRSGILNTYAGYGLELPIISVENGLRTNYCPEIDLGLTGKKPPNTGNIQRRTLAPVYFSGTNQTQEYVKAPVNYDYGNAILSMEAVEIITLMGEFDVKVGDIINITDVTSYKGNINQNNSGKYFISKVVRGIANGAALMRILATRDSGLQQP